MNILKYVIGAVIGGVLGFGLYKFVGCSTGACPITSNQYVSVIYGSVMGLIVVGGFGWTIYFRFWKASSRLFPPACCRCCPYISHTLRGRKVYQAVTEDEALENLM